jgi:formylglycine-generating enzyme required for sulfatase activity
MRFTLLGGALSALLLCSACANGGPPPEVPGMVWVSEGKFKMGYDKGRPNEKPEREVDVATGFYMGKHEVTNDEYARFIAASKRATPSHWTDGKFPEGEGSLPVTNVSWDDARLYCEWKGTRLPTETEWEYAARGKESRLFPWGNEWKSGAANNFEAGKNGPVAVGSFAEGKGPFGTFDQAGNVWEWTASMGPGEKQMIIKGGSYAPLEDRPRASLRGVVGKDQAKPTVGFRVAKDKE